MSTAYQVIALATAAGLLGAVLYNAEGVSRLLRAIVNALAGGLRAVSPAGKA